MGVFHFRQFSVDDAGCAMKIGTDSVLLGAWADVAGMRSVIDMGTGSGVLALMIAQRAPNAEILGIEADGDAAKGAQTNFDNSPWSDSLRAVCADVMTFTPERQVDLMISNPPFFAAGITSPDASRAKARHTSGSFGPLASVELASRWLSPVGSLAMVTPADYDDEVTYLAETLRLNIWRKCMVSTTVGKAPSRILWQISKDRQIKYQPSSLAIRDHGVYTPEYQDLTQDFYLPSTFIKSN